MIDQYIKPFCLGLICIFFSLNMAEAQDLPNTNIYMFTMTSADEGYHIRYPKFLTKFNAKGYNNQPEFMNDFELLISSDYGPNGSVEILKLDLFDKIFYRLTDSNEDEYSPRPVGKKYFSSVRVEEDDSQTLTLFTNDMTTLPQHLLTDMKNIGYYNWLNDKEVALFLVGEPNKLAIANVFSEQVTDMANDIGRTLKLGKDGKLIYLHKAAANSWFIKVMDPLTRQSDIIVEALAGVEDFDVLNDGTIIAGKGSRIYYYKPNKTKGWTVIKDLADYGINDISRIAVRKNKIILVNKES